MPANPFLALLCAVLLLAACRDDTQDDPRTKPPKVRISTVAPAETGIRSFTGVVSVRVESDLGFRVSGKIAERLVDTGQTVRRGQVLMTMDENDLRLQVQAKQQAVAANTARVKQTSAEESRYRSLAKLNAASKSEYDQMKMAMDTAKAQLSASQAELKIAQNSLRYATLVADGDGVITEILAEVGQVVGVGQGVIRLAKAGQREAVVNLPETLRPRIGTRAEAVLYGSGQSDTAVLRQLSAVTDTLTRTYQARFVLQDTLADAPLGATVSIRFDEQDSDNLKPANQLQVPIGAVLNKGKESGVWVVHSRDNVHKVVWRTVNVHKLSDETAWVSGDLNSGEQVVALGVHLLHDKQTVLPLDDNPSARPDKTVSPQTGDAQ